MTDPSTLKSVIADQAEHIGQRRAAFLELESLCRKAVEALEPFSAKAAWLDRSWTSTHAYQDADHVEIRMLVSDLRRAREVLSELNAALKPREENGSGGLK